MATQFFNSACNIRLLHHIEAREGGQHLYATEPVVGRVADEDVIHRLALEQHLPSIAKCRPRRIPGQRQHVLLAMHLAARAILLARILARPAITRQKTLLEHARGKYLIDILLVDPRHAEPEDRRLQDDDVCPQMLVDLALNVVALLYICLLHPIAARCHLLPDDACQGAVQLAAGDAFKKLMCVDDQYVFHRLLFLNNQWSDEPSHLPVGFGVVGSITLTRASRHLRERGPRAWQSCGLVFMGASFTVKATIGAVLVQKNSLILHTI
ncbi:hypothetical protein D3C79_660620 [compost metagenome]